MFEQLKRVNIALFLFIIVTINSIRDINIAQALVALGVFGLYAYNKYLDHVKKPDITGDMQRDLESVKNIVSGLAIKNSTKPNQTSQELKRLF